MVRDGSMRYLAFYQPKVFGAKAFRIEWFAKVTNVSIVKRVELLPNEPGHPYAGDDYYKIEFKEARQLAEPIISRKNRRLIFITTTYTRFRRAREINDLFYESPIEERMWTALRRKRIEAERQYWLQFNDIHLCLDFAVFAKQHCIAIECDGDTFHMTPQSVKNDKQRDNLLTSHGWSVLRYTTEDIMNSLPDCTRQIQKTIEYRSDAQS